MRRVLVTVLALCVVSAFAAAAVAQDSVMWMDVRGNSLATNTYTDYNAITMSGTLTGPWAQDGPVNGGKRGAGQVLRIEPVHNDSYQTSFSTSFPNLDGDGNRASGSLWVYMDVLDDASGTNDVISSVGIDFDVQPNVATIQRNRIQSVGYTMMNDGSVLDSVTPPVAMPWNGVASGAMSGAAPAPDWNDARAVAVPVTSGPAYSSTDRLVPRPVTTDTVRPYRLGRMTVTGATRVCTGATLPPFDAVGVYLARSTYNVYMNVDSLLVTRVFETGGDAIENVAMGYNGAVPDNNAGAYVNGSVAGASANNTVPDAIIEVRLKGDYNGSGTVNSADTGSATTFHLRAVGDATDNAEIAYAGDYTPPPGPPVPVAAQIANLVNSADTTFFLGSFAASSSCP